MATRKQKGLGRGLDALLGVDSDVISSLGKNTSVLNSLQDMPIDNLQPGKYQPRTFMDTESIQELSESIKEQGVMQPIIVRKADGKDDTKFEIVAGERRMRAAKLAGLESVPVIIREISDESAAIMALIENIQREDLNPIEEAQGVKRLLDEFGLTHEQASRAIGRSRSATSNILRLLNLAMPVQRMLLAGDIDMGHARALLSLSAAEQIQIANLVVAKRLSVRETEKLVQNGLEPPEKTKANSKKEKNRDILRLEEALSDRLGTSVRILAAKGQKGKLELPYHDWDQLQGILQRMGFDGVLENN